MDLISPHLGQVVALTLDTSRHEPFGHLFHLLSKGGGLSRLSKIYIRQPYSQNKTLPAIQEGHQLSTFSPLLPLSETELDLTHRFRLNTILFSRADWLLDMKLPATGLHLTSVWDD
jgi:hypothetical protein